VERKKRRKEKKRGKEDALYPLLEKSEDCRDGE
jgi:hypothetical protein